MKFLKKPVLPIAMFSIFAMTSHQALAADSVNGTVGVTMNVTGSCLINGGQVSNGGSFGNLDFGSQISLFDTAGATVKSSGGSLLTIQCNAGSSSTPTMTLISGANDASATSSYNHAMKNGSSYINYSLYKDSGYTSVINPNDAFFSSSNDGSTETVAIYAKAVGANGLAVGLYTDTITLKIDF